MDVENMACSGDPAVRSVDHKSDVFVVDSSSHGFETMGASVSWHGCTESTLSASWGFVDSVDAESSGRDGEYSSRSCVPVVRSEEGHSRSPPDLTSSFSSACLELILNKLDSSLSSISSSLSASKFSRSSTGGHCGGSS